VNRYEDEQLFAKTFVIRRIHVVTQSAVTITTINSRSPD